MAEAKVKWIGDGSFVGVDSTQHSVVLSTPKDNIGMKPSELMLVSLASCSSVDVVNILTKRKKNLKDLKVEVTAKQDEDPPWTFRSIHMKFTVSGDDITEKELESAIELSETKYCSVAATLRGVAEITTSFEII